MKETIERSDWKCSVAAWPHAAATLDFAMTITERERERDIHGDKGSKK